MYIYIVCEMHIFSSSFLSLCTNKYVVMIGFIEGRGVWEKDNSGCAGRNTLRYYDGGTGR
jgi:hypothetical protein